MRLFCSHLHRNASNTRRRTGGLFIARLPRGILRRIVRSKLAKDAYHPDHNQIRVLARYFPEYIDADEKWENSDVYEGSYDCAQMSVIMDGTTKCARTPVGAFWNEYIFDVLYQNCGRINTLTIQCDKKNLQIAKVEMVLVKD